MAQSNVPGKLCYLIHGSHSGDLAQCQDFQTAVNAELPGKVILVDSNSREARELTGFFALTDHRLPVLLIVREDDSLAYHWTASLPTVDNTLYHLRQIGD